MKNNTDKSMSWFRGKEALTGAIMIVVLMLCSVAIRLPNIVQRPLLSHNEDATGHVLATAWALNNAKGIDHHFLPLITQTQYPVDRHVDSFPKATIAGERGNHYYISFPPLGFTVPALIFRTLGIDPSVMAIRIISIMLGLVSCLLLYATLVNLARYTNLSRNHGVVLAFCIACLFAFNSESLWIFGNIYWHHVLMMPVFIGALLAMSYAIERPGAVVYASLFFTLFLSASIEWAGFTLCGGVFLVGLYQAWRDRSGFGLILVGSAAPIMALCLIFLQFSRINGLRSYLSALSARPADHVIGTDFIKQVLLAYGLLYLPLVIMGAVLVVSGRRKRLTDGWNRNVLSVIFVAAAGCVEGVVLSHHTVWYTYGSLPITTFIMLALFMAYLLSSRSIRLMISLSLISIIYYSCLYFIQNPTNLRKTPFGMQYDTVDKIGASARPDELVFVNGSSAFGIELWRSHRNIIVRKQSLGSMQRYLANHPSVRYGRLFLIDIDNFKGDRIWWPYIKSGVFPKPKLDWGVLFGDALFDSSELKVLNIRPVALKNTLMGKSSTFSDIIRSGPLEQLLRLRLPRMVCSRTQGEYALKCTPVVVRR